MFEDTRTCSEQMMRGGSSDPSPYNEEVVSKSHKRVQLSPEQTTEPKRGEKDQSKQKKPLLAYTSQHVLLVKTRWRLVSESEMRGVRWLSAADVHGRGKMGGQGWRWRQSLNGEMYITNRGFGDCRGW